MSCDQAFHLIKCINPVLKVVSQRKNGFYLFRVFDPNFNEYIIYTIERKNG